jgi:phosphate transport system substrate-binding protein
MLYKHSLTFTWAMLMVSTPFAGAAMVLAQPTSTSVTLPAGTGLRISDSSQMAPINQALMQSFEVQVPNAQVTIQPGEAVAGLEAVLAGKADLASISRPLTEDERRQGLVQVPVTREKIAIVVGSNNPFQQSLTIDLVNKITAGEITDWQQVGGVPGPIRMIQRSPTSNAAQALQRYPQLRTTLAGQTNNDQPVEIEGLAAALGQNGVSFALVSELANRSDIRAVPMYGKLPEDERYPFSQPFTYVYKKDANAAVQAFLGFVAGDAGQRAVAVAIANPKNFPTQASTTPPAAPATPTAAPTPSESEPSAPPAPVGETSTAGGEESSAGQGQIDWLPLVLVAAGLGVLALAVIKATAVRDKKASIPKPAPNYSERVKTETSGPENPTAEAVAVALEPEPLPIEPPEETRRRENIVPEFAEFNTQMQVAATRLQVSADSESNHDTENHADSQFQGFDDADDTMSTRLQMADEQNDENQTKLQVSEKPDPETQVQDLSVTRLQEPENQG